MTLMEQYNWVGFDFDNTLHYFREASSSATSGTLKMISLTFDRDLEELKTSYKSILGRAENAFFVEDKTSNEYRSERFGALFEEFDIPMLELHRALNTYEEELSTHLKAKDGALEVLQQAKKMGYEVLIITEAPYDAQETTILKLGFNEYIDLLETSSRQQMSKSDGLVHHVLREGGYDKSKGLYVGDSIDRDIEPAMADGIRSIWLSETKEAPSPDIHRIESLGELLPILKTHAPS